MFAVVATGGGSLLLATAPSFPAFAVFAVTLVGAPTLDQVSDAVGRDGVLAASFTVGVAGYAGFLAGRGPLRSASGRSFWGWA